LYAAVLIKNLVWSAGDQTDVIRAGFAALPLGLITALTFPGGRREAFVAVSACAAINVACIFLLCRWFARKKPL
jgi:hypothetical protein